ncbi:PQQ-dependent sugar dehydrogenase [Hyphomicrobium sp. CS1GBMeth3]|uniref:PQQ-dependent sugar dehydrogenase n=1 Tax=Hyphomicrobium sp. CS1GBMeth3 TaxID=1892845 RepID=UPI00111484AD|nr:PQQ-dependent sugar dehydrogenase [Hyphomicrobium sp. CS1GBMeth3]
MAKAKENDGRGFSVQTIGGSVSRLRAPKSLTGRSKKVQSSDYILRLVELRADGFTPARIAPLGGAFLLGISLQNEADVQLIDLDRALAWQLGKLPIADVSGVEASVWPRILDLRTLSVTWGRDADDIERPLSADILISGSVFDGAENKRCQLVFVKTLKITFDEKPTFEAVEDWFKSPCVPEEIGTNHSWESGGGLELVPVSARRDPSKIEFYLGLGHFHAIHDTEWLGTLSEADRQLFTAVIRVAAPGNSRIVATGMRNTQGLANVFVPGVADPVLVGTDQGPYSGDEINIITAGEDYGWPQSTFGARYDERDRYVAKSERFHASGTRPVYFFAESGTAASPIIQVHGEAFSDAWAPRENTGLANLIVGAMARGSLYRIVFDGHKVLTAEALDIGFRPRSIVDLDDRIAIGSDEGVVAFLYPEQVRTAGKFRPLSSGVRVAFVPKGAGAERTDVPVASGNLLDGDAARGAVVFNRCRNCHSLEQGGQSSGPSLHGVFGRRPSDTEDYRFSEAMLKLDPRWDAVTLDRFIERPRKFAPGTKMLFQGIADPQDRADLITFLKSVTN